MDESGSPTLEVGFEIAFGESFAELLRLNSVIDDATANAIKEFAAIERASKSMDMSAPTASFSAFGNAATRELQNVAREKAKTEKAGESLIRQLEREAASLGKTRDEMREARVEAVALAAAQQGNTDLADRLFAASRKRQFAAEGVAEAEMKAAASAQADAEATRRAAEAYQMFEAVAKQRMAAYREQQAIQGADAKQVEAARAQAAAEAAVNAQLLERSRIQAALERNTGVGAMSATDRGATFSALDAKAAADEARALQVEAAAAEQAARAHAELVAAVRGSHDAQEADAAAAERLRMSTDPLYAATKRLNAEIAESTRLYYAGATGEAEYKRQQQVLNQQLLATTVQHNAMALAGQKNAFALRMMAIQMPDVVQGLMTGQKPMTVFIQQGGQIAQIAMMAEGGIKGMAAQIGLLSLRFLPFLPILATGYAAIKRFQSSVKDDGELTRYRDNLGLTHKEMLRLSDGVETAGGKIKKLGDVTVTTGDVLAGLWQAIKDGADVSPDWSSFKSGASDAFDWVLNAWNITSAGITSGIMGTFNAVKTIWSSFPAVFSEMFVDAANGAIAALNALVKAGVDQLNTFIAAANKVNPFGKIGPVSAPQVSPIANANAGASAKMWGDVGGGYRDSYDQELKRNADLSARTRANALQHRKDAMDAEAAAIKANRTPKHPKKTSDHGLGESLAELDAQIKGQRDLAVAYGVSDAAVMEATALQKAEQEAIRHKGETSMFYSKELMLAVEKEIADGAKRISDLNYQTAAQKEVNDAVAAGLIPASQMSQALQNATEKRQMLAALAVAEEKGQADQVARLKAKLEGLGKAQADANAEANRAQVLADTQSGKDQLERLRLEATLIGATNEVRAVAIAQLEAEQYLRAHPGATPEEAAAYVETLKEVGRQTERNALAQDAWNASLTFTADQWDIIASKVQTAGEGMADAFGHAGRAIGDLASVYANYQADRARAEAEHSVAIKKAGTNEILIAQENARFALRSSGTQIAAFGDMAAAAKGFFKEGTSGYQAMQHAEQVFRAVQFALSVRAMAQNAAETVSSIAKSGARTAAHAVEAVVKAISSLPFPLNLAAGAATAAAIAALGVSIAGSFGGGGNKPAPTNDGSGTVLGDVKAQSDSLKRSMDALKEVDTTTSIFAREMAASLRSIDNQIGGFATQIVKAGDINASAGVQTGFKTDATGKLLSGIVDPFGLLSKIPIIGGIFSGIKSLIGSLFGSTTTVTASGLFGAAQSLGSILSGGFDASTFSDIAKTHKFLGIKTGTSYSTQFGAADPGLENQFTLLLRSFSDAIASAAGPLGESTAAVEARLNGFVLNIGKIDLKGLTATEIQDKLTAIFGAAADNMALAAFPDIAQFQKAGEGAFETLVRVGSTLESVTNALDMLGGSAATMSMAAKLGLADQFDSVSALNDAANAYFQAYYTKEEQAAAKAAQMTKVFESLGLTMPSTLAAFRQLVEAQDLTTAAGQETYATLLKLAPAFADLQSALAGAKSAADILSERQDLERQLLQLQGNTEAIRQLDLAKLDESNRALQLQIWAIQDGQEAAKAADDLRQAWQSVGDSIMDEVKRIRGLSDATGGSYASLLGQFNATTAAARGGDMDAAKALPQLSQALLTAAQNAVTSRQELDRIRAQTAASLEATYGLVTSLVSVPAVPSASSLLSAGASSQPAAAPANDNPVSAIAAKLDDLVVAVDTMREETTAGLAATASNTGAMKRTLENVTQESGGNAVRMAIQ